MDVLLIGWGTVCEGRIAKGKWPVPLQNAHINFLDLLTVFLALKHFVQFLKNHHVLIRSDNSGGIHKLTRGHTLSSASQSDMKIDCVGHTAFPGRATHVPGIMNVGADLLSRGNPLYGEWTLQPQVVSQLWERFGRTAVDLFASHNSMHCPLFFSLAREVAPIGVDALVHPWPNALYYAFLH